MAGFVVKATAPEGDVSWLSPPALGGLTALVSRAAADLFPTRVAAYAAIDSISYTLEQAGVKFSIEPAG
jgi:hypothetical protein